MLKRAETATRTESRIISKINRLKHRIKRTRTESVHKSLVLIDDYLTDAKYLRLDANVVTDALLFMKQDPRLTPSEAMRLGFEKWLI